MKIFRSALFLILVVVMLMVSCSENPGTTTMKLILANEGEPGAKTLLPSDSTLLDVTRYTITGTGPNGKTFTRNSDSSSVEIEGLTIGEWTVTAKGLNREGTVLVSGSLTFRLTATATPQTIVLDTLVGTGTFCLTLDWSLCDVASPAMDVYLTGPDMNGNEVALAVTLNAETKIATVSESLAAGSYKVRAILKDGGTKVAGLVEAVRISNGTQTSGSHMFHFSELGPGTLTYFRDVTGTPIKGVLGVSGSPESFLDNSPYTFLFTFSEPDKVSTEGLSIEWYYDGVLAQSQTSLDKTGSSFNVTVSSGVHRVDAVVYNKLIGSTGSASYSFTAVPDGQVGEMALLNESAAATIDTFNSNSIITALPDDMFLVVTPDSARMYICTVSSRALQVVKTYTSSNFPWLANTKHVFSDPDMNIVIATDNMNGTESFTALYYNPSARTIEQVTGMRHEGMVSSYGLPFTNFTACAFDSVFGLIHLSDAGTLGYDYILKATSSSVALGGTTRKKGSTYYNVADMDSSPNGLYMVSASASSASFVSASITDNGSYLNTAISEAASSALSKVRYANNQTVLAANSNEITTYKVNAGSVYTRYKTVAIAVNDIAADGANYFYVADNSCRLVSFAVTGYEVSQLGSTTLASQIRSVCLSGKYLAAVLSDSTVALFEVIE